MAPAAAACARFRLVERGNEDRGRQGALRREAASQREAVDAGKLHIDDQAHCVASRYAEERLGGFIKDGDEPPRRTIRASGCLMLASSSTIATAFEAVPCIVLPSHRAPSRPRVVRAHSR